MSDFNRPSMRGTTMLALLLGAAFSPVIGDGPEGIKLRRSKIRQAGKHRTREELLAERRGFANRPGSQAQHRLRRESEANNA